MNFFTQLSSPVQILMLSFAFVVCTYVAAIGGLAIWRKGKIKFGKLEIDGDDDDEQKEGIK